MDLLPPWLLVIAAVSFFNTLQCFTGTAATELVYSGSKGKHEVTPLMARMFANWTMLSAFIRFQCSRNCYRQRLLYQVTMFTFAMALLHFSFECIVYGTVEFNSFGFLSPLFVASISLIWMTRHYSFYTANNSANKKT